MPENIMSPPIKIIDSFPHPTAYKYNEERWYNQHGGSLVIINCTSSNIDYPEHWTPLSIKCAFGGKECYHFPNNAFAVSQENFLILNEGAMYRSSIHSENPTESYSLNFTKDNINQLLSSITSTAALQLDDPFLLREESFRFVEKLYPHNNYLSSFLFKIRNLVRNKHDDTSQYLELAYALLESMVLLQKNTNIEIDRIRAKRRSTKEELYKRLNLAKDYMDSFFHEEISLNDLSKICFLNPFYLLREFKKNFLITPHQYLMNVRLQQAAILLSESDISITELGKKIGFRDLSSFSKLFKRYSGLSPENFRNTRTSDFS